MRGGGNIIDLFWNREVAGSIIGRAIPNALKMLQGAQYYTASLYVPFGLALGDLVHPDFTKGNHTQGCVH